MPKTSHPAHEDDLMSGSQDEATEQPEAEPKAELTKNQELMNDLVGFSLAAADRASNARSCCISHMLTDLKEAQAVDTAVAKVYSSVVPFLVIATEEEKQEAIDLITMPEEFSFSTLIAALTKLRIFLDRVHQQGTRVRETRGTVNILEMLLRF